MTEQALPAAEGPDWFWSDYWRSGQQACCFNVGGENYGPQLIEAWTAFFESLPLTARILDLCTGNGAIAIIAAEIGQRRSAAFEVHAVDRAEIFVEKTRLFTPRLHGTIQFKSGIAAETLPFEDASFDAVVGQFAIEYTDLPRTVSEIARVTKQGGGVRFVVHARDGTLMSAAEGELAGAQFLEEKGIIGAARDFVTQAAEIEAAGAGASDEQKQRAGEAAMHLQTLIKALDDAVRLLNAAVFLQQFKQSLGEVLQKRRVAGHEAAVARLDDIARRLEGHCRRLRAMMSASQDERGARAIAQLFENAGLKPEPIMPLHIPKESRLFGWQIAARK